MRRTPRPGAVPEAVRIPAADGFALAGTVFTVREGLAGVVLVAPATGVRRTLYRHFADHLASRGLAAITWDWRGTGDSRPESLRGFHATMRHWAERDLAGVIAWARDRFAGAPLLALGHSFGGQAMGLASNAHLLRALVTVGAQSGWWGHWPLPRRWAYALLWHVAVPAATSAAGYFPARRLGLGEDLPAGVAREWAEWCRSPQYLGDWSGHRRFAAPILAWSFTDDPFAPPKAVAALHAQYVAAPLLHRAVAPWEVGASRIGHFGFFRPGVPALWRETSDWLLGAARG